MSNQALIYEDNVHVASCRVVVINTITRRSAIAVERRGFWSTLTNCLECGSYGGVIKVTSRRSEGVLT